MIALIFLIQIVVLNELEKPRRPYLDRAHVPGVPLRKISIEDRLSERQTSPCNLSTYFPAGPSINLFKCQTLQKKLYLTK